MVAANKMRSTRGRKIEAMVEALGSLDLKPVPVSPEQDRRFAEARRMLDEDT